MKGHAVLRLLLATCACSPAAGRKGRKGGTSIRIDDSADPDGGSEQHAVAPATNMDRGAWERAMGVAASQSFGDGLGGGGGAVNGDVKYLWDEATEVFTQERFEEAEELWLNVAELVPPQHVDAATNYAHCFRRQKRCASQQQQQ